MAQASEQPIDTFSVVFEDKRYDESPWSRMIASLSSAAARRRASQLAVFLGIGHPL